jgi:transketolase C-terminal domain/subunit
MDLPQLPAGGCRRLDLPSATESPHARPTGTPWLPVGARDPRVVALDAEVSNSTYASGFAHTYPNRYFEMFIAEQQMVAAATGLAVRGYTGFASTFAAFFTRAYDFIRMGAISAIDLRLVGSHAGVEIGADGPSQMALEDLAMMRAVHGSTVLYPSDATSTVVLVGAMATTKGISYLRTTRGAPGAVLPRRSLSGRRVETVALQRARSGHTHRCRRYSARVPASRRRTAGRRHFRSRH